MKIFKIAMVSFLALTLGCKDGYIDDISRVDPGPDADAPTVTLNYPLNGTEIQVYEEVTTLRIDFEAEDDIRLETIEIVLDGNQLTTMSDFKDYRRVVEEYMYENLETGEHTLSITATDDSGKSTTETVEFAKVPPYITKYDGEVLYMPFDGDYIDLVTVTYPTEVGMPGFAGEGKVGGNAYAGASNSYLTFPADEFKNSSEFTAVFWMKVNATPDRAGILVAGPEDMTNPDAQKIRTSG